MTKEIDYVELLKLAHEKLGSQSDMIAELESNILMLEQYNGSVESLIKDIKAHNLEQQAKGISSLEFIGHESEMWCTWEVKEWLSNQAKALKEQGK